VPERYWKFRLRHIVESIDRVNVFVNGISFDEFCEDPKTCYAVITCFAVIGEASRLISDSVRSAYTDIPWNQMRRMRNVLVHEYDRIDYEIVWRTIQNDHPDVREMVGRILKISE
jgi:uncharacterized protein with HEPN domain